jgi:hypothetical protein
MKHDAQSKDRDFFLHVFFSVTMPLSLDTRHFSLDNLIRSRQHVGWNRQADLLGRLEIDHQLKLRGLLHWQIARLGSFENFIYVDSDAPVAVARSAP